MKRLTMLLILTFTLIGCVKVPETDNQSVAQVFQNLTINLEVVFVNKMYEVDGVSVDHIEMLNQINSERILIHVLIHSELETLQADYKVLITPNFVYLTQGMHRVSHHYDITNKNELQTLINTYTDLLDLTKFTNNALTSLALSLNDKNFSTHSGRVFFSGETLKEPFLPPNSRSKIEMVYKNNTLLEFHFRNEYLFDSTKQESNYISGIHYFFTDQLEIEFPPLQEFNPMS
ncbi:hypothetical protein [Liberiplasma polymorphum]|uniref:hypothetical protein n=1 Tax=Liberiplasma polymorphum TaxID=3374570 RepID=UPI0037733318